MSGFERAVPFPPGDGRSDEDLKTLGHFVVAAVDRAAQCYQDRSSAFCWERAFDNLFDYWFWETLYGPAGEDDACGLTEWDHPDDTR